MLMMFDYDIQIVRVNCIAETNTLMNASALCDEVQVVGKNRDQDLQSSMESGFVQSEDGRQLLLLFSL